MIADPQTICHAIIKSAVHTLVAVGSLTTTGVATFFGLAIFHTSFMTILIFAVHHTAVPTALLWLFHEANKLPLYLDYMPFAVFRAALA